MHIGKLNQRVEIQTVTETRNSFGEVSKTWATTGKRWASVVPLTGRELELNRQIHNQVDYKVTLRHSIDIHPSQRILWKGKVLEILSTINVNTANLQWDCLCKEVI